MAPILSYFLVLALPAISHAAALPQETDGEVSIAIIGGTAASLGEFPYIVSVQFKQGDTRFHHCGGSLIDATTVVTAAHCMINQDASGLSVRAGVTEWRAQGADADVASYTIHPNYNSSRYEWDIALIKLATPIETSANIAYAKLPAPGSEPAAGTPVTVAGWGTVSNTTLASSPDLLKLDINVVDRDVCQQGLDFTGVTITPDMLCAGDLAGGRDSCWGDSGGPLVDESGTLVGAVSWGWNCAQPGLSGVYANIGNLLSFIRPS
ncbi:serine endopeptidase [Corynespora cassiicola Philippines]|uniref:Serine endopeptidase n=1 Tax=Corynespora cassiicola Philippines TaxID=1448308 RepID=A0A2T2NQW0_CORCC|nr:serine endopeptidase [Corynespora cassiicola Philippines]